MISEVIIGLAILLPVFIFYIRYVHPLIQTNKKNIITSRDEHHSLVTNISNNEKRITSVEKNYEVILSQMKKHESDCLKYHKEYMELLHKIDKQVAVLEEKIK